MIPVVIYVQYIFKFLLCHLRMLTADIVMTIFMSLARNPRNQIPELPGLFKMAKQHLRKLIENKKNNCKNLTLFEMSLM